MSKIKQITSLILIYACSAWIIFFLLNSIENNFAATEIAVSCEIYPSDKELFFFKDDVHIQIQKPVYTFTLGLHELKNEGKFAFYSKQQPDSFLIRSVTIKNPFYEELIDAESLSGTFKLQAANVQDRGKKPENTSRGLTWKTENKPFMIRSKEPLFSSVNSHFLYIKIAITTLLLLVLSFLFRKRIAHFLIQDGLPVITIGFATISILLIFAPPTTKSTENRNLAEFPSWEKHSLWSFPKHINEWYNDRFPLRTVVPKFYNYFKLEYLNQSPLPSKVLKGVDNWFYSNDPDVADVVRGENLYSLSELKTIQKNIEERRDFVAHNGGEYFLMICPLKHFIYPEYLPEKLEPTQPENKYFQLLQFLKTQSDIHIIDLYPMLKHAKGKKKIYYKADTHWNQYGAYLAYQEILKQMAEFTNDSALSQVMPINLTFNWDVRPHGDLLDVINLKEFYPSEICLAEKENWMAKEEIKAPYTTLKFDGPPHYWFSNEKASLNKQILLYRDSYSVYLIPYLSETFESSSYFWTRTFHAEPILDEKPDYVIDEGLARFMDFYLNENPTLVKEGAAKYRALLR